MANAFSAAMDMIFADPNVAADAFYRIGGILPDIPVRVILSAPDEVERFGRAGLVSDTTVITVRVNEVATPSSGDVFVVDGLDYQAQGAPLRDNRRLVWKIDTVLVP